MEVFNILKTDFENKTTLIEASAGTGKTYTITSLVVRLILLKKIPVEEILVVTFTEATASELKDRILSRLRETIQGFVKKEEGREGEIEDPFIRATIDTFYNSNGKELIKRAIRSFDLAPVFTIHGFCYRILSENAFETKNFFNSEIITDENILIRQSADDFYRKYIDNATIEEARIIHLNNLYPDTIAELAKKYLKYENLEIISSKSEKDISLIFNEFTSSQEKLAELWFEERSALEIIFDNDESLNRQKYRPAYFRSRAGVMDEVFENRYNSPDTFTKEKVNGKNNPFLYFTKSSIEKSIKKGKTAPQNYFFEEAESFYNKCLEIDEDIKKFIACFKQKAIQKTKDQLDKIKDQYRLLGFNDFLTRVKKGLDEDKTGLLINILKKRYKAAFIDEFQDTDSLQYEIFNHVFKGRVPLFFIGDPKQAIYRFRGADLFAYLKAKDDSDYQYTMDKNYRSSPGAINSVNKIFSLSDNPFLYQKVGFQNIIPAKDDTESVFEKREKSSSMNIVYLKGEPAKKYAESDKFINTYICSEISRLLNMSERGEYQLGEKVVCLEDIAVLVRSNSRGREIRSALEESGIPAVLTSEESVFDSDEALAILEFLDCVHNNSDERKIKGVLTGDLFLRKTSDLNTLIKDENLWNQIVEDFREYRSLWSEKGIMEMLNYLYYEKNILHLQASLSSGERRITNLLHIFEILHEEEIKNKHGQESLIKWFADNIYNRISSRQEYELRLESDKNKVRILTVHKSKGLEFPVVFCAFIQREARTYLSGATEVLYHRESDNSLVLNLNPSKDDSGFSLMEKELLSEDLRLFYVAITRAKYKTWVFMNENIKHNFMRSPDYILYRLNESDIENTLVNIESDSNGDIKTEIYDSVNNLAIYDFKLKKEKTAFNRCIFTKNPVNNFKILSFSSIATNSGTRDDEKLDLETKDIALELADDPLNLGIHGFPRGAFAGIFFHSIFEDLDFQCKDEEIETLVELKLQNFNYDIKWLPSIFAMVKNVLNKDLSKGFRLSDIPNQKRLTELEFYYSLKENEINTFFNKLINSSINPLFRTKLKRLSPDAAKGFMKGFIDLVFEHKGKFYILDWKSNHLGFSYSDYNLARLEEEIAGTSYFLQYYIYSAALDKYLEYRLGQNYTYEKNFGGVYYLFLRGISGEYDDSGVYFDIPLKIQSNK